MPPCYPVITPLVSAARRAAMRSQGPRLRRAVFSVELACCLALAASVAVRAGTVSVNFDSVNVTSSACVAAGGYLTGFGIGVSGVTPGTLVGIGNTNYTYSGQ